MLNCLREPASFVSSERTRLRPRFNFCLWQTNQIEAPEFLYDKLAKRLHKIYMEEQKQDGQLNKEEGELEKLQKEKDEYLNGWKRAKADLINYQKDETKRFEEMVNYSREMVIGDVIPVLDSMEFALRAETDNDGLQRIKIQLEDMLKKYGLEKIKVSPGDALDTNLHESIGEMEVKDVESGKIAVEVSSGYKLKNKVIRPARVKLSK